MAMLFSVMSFAQEAWLLVTDASTLAAGDQVVVVAKDYNYALSTNQKSNNRGHAAITKSGNEVTITNEVQVLTLKAGQKAGTFALYTGNGYLCAASSSNNYLKTEASLSTNSSWSINISNGTATVKANGNYTRNVMQYNQSSSLFACYSSASQKAIALYKKTVTTGMISTPNIEGNGTFISSTSVTITAEEGLEIYYTTDGSDPIAQTSVKYTAPFELTETTTIKAIAYDATADKASSVVSKAFTKIPVLTCAEASALAKDKIAALKPFDVVYVVEGTGNIYIKDETGTGLIYDYNLDDKLKAGDHVEGFVGISSPYYGLPEMKAHNVTYDDLTVTSGTAPEPTVFTVAPVEADVNKYIKFENVTLTADATFNTVDQTNATMVVNGTNVTLRNNFKLAATLSQYKAYDIVGFVAIYNSDIQVYFLSATEVADLEREEYTISWSVNGTIKETTTVLEGDELVLPAAPEAPNACSEKVFVGWTAAEEVNDDGSDITWVTAATVPASNATYYAVFALQEGEGGVTPTEVSVNIGNYATANSWVDATPYLSVTIDENITATATGGSNTGKYYNNGNNWRLYQNESPTLTIAAAEGVTISTVAVTYSVSNTGVLTLGGANVESGAVCEINAASVTFGVGNTGSAANGQVRVTDIDIVYTSGSPATYSDYSTTCEEVVDPETPTSVDNIEVSASAVKAIENGQLIVIKNGVKYNALGQEIK